MQKPAPFTYDPFSVGYPAFTQAWVPPRRTAAFTIPFLFASDAQLALLCSFAQEQ